jgi:hypothetical protein
VQDACQAEIHGIAAVLAAICRKNSSKARKLADFRQSGLAQGIFHAMEYELQI